MISNARRRISPRTRAGVLANAGKARSAASTAASISLSPAIAISVMTEPSLGS